MTKDIAELFRRANDAFGDKVHAVRDDQWANTTPCTEWNVRMLANHLIAENLWIPPLLDGKTIEDVGDRFDGDVTGQDPKATWDQAAKETNEAVAQEGAMERTVHLSYGDVPGERYLSEVFCDLVVHGWDLARAIGADEAMDPELLDACFDIGVPIVKKWKAFGMFGPEIEPPPGADRQTELLALYGRVA